ncbi:tolloid-like protein 2 [Glandiceps talaboti]
MVYTEDNTRIRVDHWDFATESCCDYYSDGYGEDPRQNSSRVNWRHSGDTFPEDFISIGSSVWIFFYSDGSVTDRGFRNRLYDTGAYSCTGFCGLPDTNQGCSCAKDCVIAGNCCSDYFELCAGDCYDRINLPQGGQVTVTSPNFPNDYPNDAQCEWILYAYQNTPIIVRFQDFYTEPDSDYFFAGNGDYPQQSNSVIWAHSGYTAPDDFSSVVPAVWMRFVSDNNVTEKGFEIIVEDTYGKGYCDGGCDWFNFEFFCSCYRDCIYSGNCCLDYFEKCGGDCTETLNVGINQYVDVWSPNYPENYPNDARCQWIVYTEGSGTGRLHVDFKDFATEDGYDVFFAGHGDQPSNFTTEIWAHSGYTLPPSYISNTGSVWLRFISDSTIVDRGFHVVVEHIDCTEEITIPAGGKTSITSPNYPNNYPDNAACKWTVQSGSGSNIMVQFQDFELEGCCDYVSSGNGDEPSQATSVIWRHNGIMLPEDYLSNMPTVWLTFTSDSSVTFRGFRVTLTDTGLWSLPGP